MATLTVGMFGLVPVAHALPVQDATYTNVGGATIDTSVTKTMGISSSSSHNVMNRKSFSIANGEKVQFDTNNYLNLVRGVSKSDITSDGTTVLTGTVTAKAAGIITVGHEVTETTTRSFTINGAATDKTVHDYANATCGSFWARCSKN